ncbi:MAG: hypothetical protein NUV74_10935 [Candidatus Brocadiaceae bacterium]|nr:hypothetical protein [Candidatus Brocadiaceae bacterium]
MSKDNRIFDLEERLIDFAVRIICTAESLPKTRAGNHIAGQLIRCGPSLAPISIFVIQHTVKLIRHFKLALMGNRGIGKDYKIILDAAMCCSRCLLIL